MSRPKGVVNKKLHDFIKENYIKADTPMSQEQIAREFGVTIGSIKNFMYRHEQNKKEYYRKRNAKIKKLYYDGIPTRDIATLYNTTPQNIYYIINNR